MTKQLLVDVARAEGDLTATTYVTVQNNERGLIKTILINANHFSKQAYEILEIAKKYEVNKIKVDIHGLGIGLFDYLSGLTVEENNNRKTGEIYLGSKDAWQQLLDKIYKIDTSEVKLNRITDEMVQFHKYVEDKLKAIDEKEEADSRTTQLKLQSQLLEEQQKVAEWQNMVIELQLQLFETKRKGNVNVDMNINTWDTDSLKGDTVKELLDKEFDSAKGSINGGTIGAGGKLAMLHKGDSTLPPKDVEKLLDTSKVLENIMKLITPTISKLNKTHETDSVNDNKEVSDALDKAVDVFNIVFNVNSENKKSTQDLVKEMANEMRTRGLR